MSYTTQCPNCQTRFKVNDSQLAAAKGRVRCGRCTHVFQADEYFIQPPAPPVPQPIASPFPTAKTGIEDDFELEVPDFDPSDLSSEVRVIPPSPPPAALPTEPGLEESFEEQQTADIAVFQSALAEAMQNRHVSTPLDNPFDEDKPAPQRSRREPDAETYNVRRTEPHLSEETLATANEDLREEIQRQRQSTTIPENYQAPTTEPEQLHQSKATPRSSLVLVLNSMAMGFGVLLLITQLVYFNRTRIAAEAPEFRPVLEQLCRTFSCSIPLPTDLPRIRTEWSELSFIPDHPNLIQLSATLKNQAVYPQAFPMLELTLKDVEDRILIRKVFGPAEYLKADDFKLGRFNPSSELKIIMRLDAGKARATGYSLYWFYP